MLLRSLAWKLTIDQALDPPRPRFDQVFSAFSVGLLGNAVLPGRIGELARVAVLRRHVPRGPRVERRARRTVFAHRLFDLFPALLLILYVIATAKVPHWAVTSLIIVSIIGGVLFTVAFVTARRQHRQIDGARSVRQLLAMARQGLAVLRSPLAALGAIVLQCAGWFMQLLAVYVAMRAFDIHASMAAAALVLLLMNVATIFPLWPGNIGPAPGRGRAAARPVRRRVLDRLRLRARPAGDRDVRRRRRRPDLPRARGTLVREPARDARRAARRPSEEETHPPERRRARARVPG